MQKIIAVGEYLSMPIFFWGSKGGLRNRFSRRSAASFKYSRLDDGTQESKSTVMPQIFPAKGVETQEEKADKLISILESAFAGEESKFSQKVLVALSDGASKSDPYVRAQVSPSRQSPLLPRQRRKSIDELHDSAKIESIGIGKKTKYRITTDGYKFLRVLINYPMACICQEIVNDDTSKANLDKYTTAIIEIGRRSKRHRDLLFEAVTSIGKGSGSKRLENLASSILSRC